MKTLKLIKIIKTTSKNNDDELNNESMKKIINTFYFVTFNFNINEYIDEEQEVINIKL